MSRGQTGEVDRVRVLALDSASAGVAGATILLAIRRDADGFFWMGTAFQSAFVQLTMSETDSVNLPGVYHYDFTPPTPEAAYTYSATSSTGTVTNGPWIGELRAGFWVDNIDAATSSRSSESDVTIALQRIGPGTVTTDIKRVAGLVDRLTTYVRSLGSE